MAYPRLRGPWPALTLVCVAALAASSARATSFTLNLTPTPSLGTIANVLDAGMNPGQTWTSQTMAISPIMVDQGDDITVNVSFAASEAIQLVSGIYDSGLELLFFDMFPGASGLSYSEATTLSSLSVVGGNLDATLPIGTTGVAGTQIIGGLATNLTDSAVLIDGFSLQTTFTSLTGGPVQLSSIELQVTAEQLNVVPEPSTAALLLVPGLLAVARLPRRSRRG